MPQTQSCSQEDKLLFWENRLICAARLTCQTTPRPYLQALLRLMCVSACLCPLSAESLVGEFCCSTVPTCPPWPLQRDMREVFESLLEWPAEEVWHRHASLHSEVCRKAGGTIHHLLGPNRPCWQNNPDWKNSPTLSPDGWIMGKRDVWREGEIIKKRGTVFGCTTNQAELHIMV